MGVAYTVSVLASFAIVVLKCAEVVGIIHAEGYKAKPRTRSAAEKVAFWIKVGLIALIGLIPFANLILAIMVLFIANRENVLFELRMSDEWEKGEKE